MRYGKKSPSVLHHTIGRDTFAALQTKRVSVIEIHSRRFMMQLPPYAKPISNTRAIVLDCPDKIIFRKRFSKETLQWNVKGIVIDRSERYDTKAIIYEKCL